MLDTSVIVEKDFLGTFLNAHSFNFLALCATDAKIARFHRRAERSSTLLSAAMHVIHIATS